MLTSSDWLGMASDMTSVRGDNPGTVTLRRGTATVAAQTVRIVKAGGGRALNSGQAEEQRGQVEVHGGTTLDVAVEDRFNLDGRLYRIKFVHPNRRMATVAEAELVE